MTNLVGKEAPDFTATAVVGNDFRKMTLSDNWRDGKCTVLFFYPKDFTFVCPTEIIAFSDRVSEFTKRDCNVVSVSTDTEFVHLAWKKTPRTEGGLGEINYPMVADTTKAISEAYDVLHPEEKVAFRGLFLIDTNGVVRHQLINDMPLGRNVDEALRMVDALQFHEEHGEVCPAGWTQGDPTIKPNPEDSKEYFEKAGTVTVNN